ncbi:MAG TPA: hypothetical protein VMP10_03475, partial [Chloroflexota bacterium]|nr:hypothetical protein [Chloroflexota bacterium]
MPRPSLDHGQINHNAWRVVEWPSKLWLTDRWKSRKKGMDSVQSYVGRFFSTLAGEPRLALERRIFP